MLNTASQFMHKSKTMDHSYRTSTRRKCVVKAPIKVRYLLIRSIARPARHAIIAPKVYVCLFSEISRLNWHATYAGQYLLPGSLLTLQSYFVNRSFVVGPEAEPLPYPFLAFPFAAALSFGRRSYPALRFQLRGALPRFPASWARL